jgi:uncharacterized RDD family membrane protein YckC
MKPSHAPNPGYATRDTQHALRTNTLLIRTPEGIVFSQLLAGPLSRFLAWLIDLFCVLALTMLLGTLLAVLQVISVGIAQAVGLLLQFVVMIGYAICCEWRWRGQTLGKRILRLRVVDAQGLRLKFSQVVIRNLLRFVDMLPFFYLVGGIACAVSRRAQRLGDLAANTLVVRIPKIAEPNLDQLAAGKFNSLRNYPHLEARLRQRVSAQEAALALQALVRRDLLDPAARVELFAQIAEHFHGKVPFPPEATDGVADEQFVRNVVDSLYRPSRKESLPSLATRESSAVVPQPAPVARR